MIQAWSSDNSDNINNNVGTNNYGDYLVIIDIKAAILNGVIQDDCNTDTNNNPDDEEV